MEDAITLKIPSDPRHIALVKKLLKELCSFMEFDKRERKEIFAATRELIENAIQHAYPEEKGWIEIGFFPFDHGIRIDVRDWGVPLAQDRPLHVPIDLKEDKGFNRIYNVTDHFEYKNLGKEGKKFTIIKYLGHEIHNEPYTPDTRPLEKPKEQIDLRIRPYRPGDEEAIARLIYRNYRHTYIKDLFYYPKQIAHFHGTKFHSIVAEADGKIVGHFALVKVPDANVAEIGVVVVDPRYKGMGIMNRMFDALLRKGKELGFAALFGEAIMYHPFSQKSNLRHGFCETALMLGKTPPDVEIEHNQLTQVKKRGSVLIGYKILRPKKRKIYLPRIYAQMIADTYERCEGASFEVLPSTPSYAEYSRFYYTFDPSSNTATIVINRIGPHFAHKFHMMFHTLLAKHCDMLYAQLNLEEIPAIDDAVAILNKTGFFYSGLLPELHRGAAYLQLQYEHALGIGRENVVCFSDRCKALLEYIKEDRRRVFKQK